MLLSADGPVAQTLDHFNARRDQQRMAVLVERALSAKDKLIVEAPAGCGKTLAYLVPIVAQNKKAIISTATHYLQHQLYRQDLPLVQRALSTSRNVAVLKGRHNYLCPYYLERHYLGEDHRYQRTLSADARAVLARIDQQFRRSNSGEISVLAPRLDPALLPYVTCSAEQCLSNACPQFSRCPLMRARLRAQQADIVIVNHSLLFSDHLMRREQLSNLLPDSEAVVIDEAHRLVDAARTLVGERLSSLQLGRFCCDAIDGLQRCAPEQRALLAFIKQLHQVVDRLHENAPALDHYDRRQHVSIIEQLLAALQRLQGWLSQLLDRGNSVNELFIRAQLLRRKLDKITAASGLCWVEARTHGCVLQNIPIDLSGLVQEVISDTKAGWIFTSATLSVENKADRFMHCLGLQGAPFFRLDSDISYQQNARLYLPQLTVNPDHGDYTEQLTAEVSQLAERIGGRLLFLFSSHRALLQAADGLIGKTELPLFVQGAADNSQLIERFKGSINGILLGTGAFWEGLDLSAAPPTAVIIDKLPFASPDQPLIRLRADELREHGVDSFQHDLLPDAVLRLRQGCGRLLRRSQDRGIIMLADPRLHNTAYGRVFLDSLPAMPRCSSLASVAKFLATDQTVTAADPADSPTTDNVTCDEITSH